MYNATTPCASFLKKTINIDDKVVGVQIWDTAGQERFWALAPQYYRGSDCVLMVYDVTNERSLQRISDFWIDQVRHNCLDDATLVIVANKIDLIDDDIVVQKGVKLAEENGICFYSTSSQTGQNIIEMFSSITRSIVQRKQLQRDSGTRDVVRPVKVDMSNSPKA